MDIKNKPITDQLQTALDYCKSRGYSILLTADTNSHSKLWGNETNTRGKKWEELIEVEHLLMHNQGRIPTFESVVFPCGSISALVVPARHVR